MTDTSAPAASPAAPRTTTPAEALARYTSAPDPGLLLALNFGFARARALGTALELGVFTELARGPRSVEDLAAVLGCDARALGDLLAVLTEFGLLTGDGRDLTELSRTYLVEGEPGCLVEHFAEVLGQWDRWSALTSVVRTGDRPGVRAGDLPGGRIDGRSGGLPRGRADDLPGDRTRGPSGDWPGDRSLGFGALSARGRHPGLFGGGFPIAVRVAFEAVEALGLRGAGRVLDLACGGGEWGIALAAADPVAEVTAHDDPVLLGSARARAAEFGVADRFRFVPADFAAPPFADGGFDTVVLAHAGRFAGPAETMRLVRECARLLRPGGTLLLADVMRPESGRPALSRPMLGLSLLLNTAAGAVPAPGEYRAFMEEAGVTAKECVTRGLVTAQTGERR